MFCRRQVLFVRPRRAAAFFIAVLAASACTTIKSGQVAIDQSEPVEGLVYYLPIRTLAIDAKFTVLDCGLNGAKAALRYDVTPTITSAIAADRSHPYAISSGLDGRVLKNLNYEITQYENGTLKGVNVVADDRTAETATSILSGAAKFGLGLTGLSFFSAESAGSTIVWLSSLNADNSADGAQIAEVRKACGSSVTDAVLEIQKLRRGTSGAKAAADAKAKAVAAVTEAEKAVSDARTVLKAANESKGDEDIVEAKRILAAAVVALIDARKAAQRLPPGAATASVNQDIAAITQRSLNFNASDMFVPSEVPQTLTRTVSFPAADLVAAGIPGAAEDLMAAIELKPTAPLPSDDEAVLAYKTPIHVSEVANGIWLRAPASASLLVCLRECSSTATRLSQIVTIPQWGQLTRLPLRNMVFAKNTTKLSFAPDGTLLSLGSDSTAAAERAGTAFQQAGATLLDFVTQRRALIAELAATENTNEKAAIQQKLDVLELNQQLAAAQSTVGPERQSQLDLLQYQIDQTEKQIKLLEKQAELKKLQAESGT